METRGKWSEPHTDPVNVLKWELLHDLRKRRPGVQCRLPGVQRGNDL
jgi:hypothetical protein